MDLLSQHEAFLRAIYDAPEDDTPRLVYADFLQENGEEDRAQFIRWQCGRGEKPEQLPGAAVLFERGFLPGHESTEVTPDQLTNTDALRRNLVYASTFIFAVTKLKVHAGRITTGQPFDVLFGLTAFARVSDLVLAGSEELDVDRLSDYTPFVIEPVITPAGVITLAQHRGLRRITALDLRNNDLDNDAARALVKSPYLDGLKRLQLLEGNRLRGKVWQQVIERFGEDVVG